MGNLTKIIIILILLLPAEKSTCQKHIVHLTYKPTSCILIDTTWAYDQWDKHEHSVAVAGFDSMEVFITPKYFASISFNTHRWIHTVYNRKTSIIRRHVRYAEKDFFVEDSVMYYLHNDKELRQKAARIKDTLLIREYPDNQTTIHGRKCHLITFPAYGWLSRQRDSVWVADFKNVPGLLSPFYFLTQGVGFEQVINDGLVSVRVSSEKRRAPNPSKEIFTIDPGKSELRQLQSQNEIVDVVNFILSFKARLP